MSDLRQQLTRSVAEVCGAARAVPLRHVSYHAFRVCPGFEGMKDVPLGGRSYDYGRLEADTLEGALDEALSCGKVVAHKEHLVIQEVAESGIKLHVYAIKQKSTPRYVHRDHQTRRQHDLYAAPVCTIDGALLKAVL